MKNEETLLAEAYGKIYQVDETVHSSDEPALGPDEERQSDGSVKNTKTGETVYTPKKEVAKEDRMTPSDIGRPFAASADVLSAEPDWDDELSDSSAMLPVHAALDKKDFGIENFDVDANTITIQTKDGSYILKIVGKTGDHDVPVSLR